MNSPNVRGRRSERLTRVISWLAASPLLLFGMACGMGGSDEAPEEVERERTITMQVGGTTTTLVDAIAWDYYDRDEDHVFKPVYFYTREVDCTSGRGREQEPKLICAMTDYGADGEQDDEEVAPSELRLDEPHVVHCFWYEPSGELGSRPSFDGTIVMEGSYRARGLGRLELTGDGTVTGQFDVRSCRGNPGYVDDAAAIRAPRREDFP